MALSKFQHKNHPLKANKEYNDNIQINSLQNMNIVEGEGNILYCIGYLLNGTEILCHANNRTWEKPAFIPFCGSVV